MSTWVGAHKKPTGQDRIGHRRHKVQPKHAAAANGGGVRREKIARGLVAFLRRPPPPLHTFPASPPSLSTDIFSAAVITDEEEARRVQGYERSAAVVTSQPVGEYTETH